MKFFNVMGIRVMVQKHILAATRKLRSVPQRTLPPGL